jgi:hypothetical protein
MCVGVCAVNSQMQALLQPPANAAQMHNLWMKVRAKGVCIRS